MASIMQGTTPSITITIDTDDFLLSDVTAIELYVKNGSTVTTYTEDELTVDTTENTVTKTFTEAETTAMKPSKNVIIQGRFWFSDGSVIGINKISIGVADMMGVGSDG